MDPIAVRAKELAELLHCSEHKIRDMTPELPHVRHKGVVFYPVEAVRQYMNQKGIETLDARRKKGVR